MEKKYRYFETLAHYFPVIGGKETAVHNLSLALKKRGHEVKILTSDMDRLGKRVEGENEYDGIGVKRFFSWLKLGPTAIFFPGIFTYLLENDYDVVIANTYRQPQTDLSLFASKLKGRKCILATHYPMMPRKGFNKLFINLYDNTVSYLTLRFYDAIFVLSEDMIPFLLSRGVKKDRIKIVPNGVDDVFFTAKMNRNQNLEKKERKIILNVATLNRIKGQELLLNAIPNMKNQDAEFWLVGPLEDSSKEIIEKAKGFPNVKIMGPKKKEELLQIYAQADIFVLPSKFEPFGIVALEAMAAGLPVVATKHGGTKNFVKKPFGLIIDPYDAKELANALDFFLENPYTSDEGYEKAKDYTWDNLARAVEEYTKDLLK